MDHSLEADAQHAEKADPNNSNHIAAGMPGMVVMLAVQPGDSVREGQKLLIIEAMKMQTTIAADRDAKVADVFVKAGSQVETGDLLISLE